MSRSRIAAALVALSLMAAGLPVLAQTLTGAAAQKSPQADVFLLYESALIDGGLDAAAKHAAPSKVKENQEMLKAFGAGFEKTADGWKVAPVRR
jgi:hypothetical protein